MEASSWEVSMNQLNQVQDGKCLLDVGPERGGNGSNEWLAVPGQHAALFFNEPGLF